MANFLTPRRIKSHVLSRLAVAIGRVAVHVLVGSLPSGSGLQESLPEAGIAAVIVGIGLLRSHGVYAVGDARSGKAAPRGGFADASIDAGITDGRHRGGIDFHAGHYCGCDFCFQRSAAGHKALKKAENKGVEMAEQGDTTYDQTKFNACIEPSRAYLRLYQVACFRQ